jgi:alginate O-acetyltransferase complex protein AlgI
MAVTTILDYVLAQRIESSRRHRRHWLILSLAGNLGLLFYFKYAPFALSSIETVVHWLSPITESWHCTTLLALTLPPGISFYTFQTLSYILDVYRGGTTAERNFFRFAGFVSFFPHLVAGPLTRHHQLIPPLANVAKSGIRPSWPDGIFLFSVGLCKKVIVADQIAAIIDPALASPHLLSPCMAWLALLGFTIQIYFDFSGYTDMAIGLGRLMGIELPQNFNDPYKALNPSDFWRRWHITLSSWIRDYLYLSLGGSQGGAVKTVRNVVVTMFLAGLWHGARWNFALWGLYHAFWLAVYHQSRRRWDSMPTRLQRITMFIIAMAGWLLFRAESINHLRAWTSAMIQHSSGFGFDWTALSLGLIIAMGTAVLAVKPVASHTGFLRTLGPGEQIALGAATVVSILMIQQTSAFIYYQF